MTGSIDYDWILDHSTELLISLGIKMAWWLFFKMSYYLEMDTEVFTSGMVGIWDVF